jgi:hypothetical protein
MAQLIRALRHHARFVDVLAGLALTPPLLELAGDPLLQLLDGVATDAQLYEMKRQEISRRITPGGLAREDSSTAYRVPGKICNGAPRLPPLFTGTAARASAIGARPSLPPSGNRNRVRAIAHLSQQLRAFTPALRSEADKNPRPSGARVLVQLLVSAITAGSTNAG